MGTSEHLRIDLDGPIGHLTLANPDKLNPLTTEMLLGIESAARHFDALPEVRVVVVAGEGRAFSAGADVAAFAGPQGGGAGEGPSVRERADAGRRMADALEAMRAVTVARIQGHCIGGGVVLAAACDLRVASSSSRFAIPEVDLGIPLAWGGIPRLVREIGAPAARDLVMTCRPVDAEEARALGLVQRVVPDVQLDDAVAALAGQLADKATLPLAVTKRHIDAVTSGAFGLAKSWADADGLVAALADEESRAAARRYLEELGRRRDV